MDTLGVELGAGPGFGVAPSAVRVIALLVGVVGLTSLLAALVARHPARATVADVLRAE